MYVILAHDGLAGSIADDENNNLIEIMFKDGLMNQVCTELQKTITKSHITKPNVIIAAGSFNVCSNNLGDLARLYCYGELHGVEVVDGIVEQILTQINDIWRVIKEKEGKLAICSLIPNHRILKQSTYRDILTEAYDDVNAEFKSLNEMISGGHYWIDKPLYYRNTKKLVKGYFENDELHLNSKGQKKVKQGLKSIIKKFTS